MKRFKTVSIFRLNFGCGCSSKLNVVVLAAGKKKHDLGSVDRTALCMIVEL